MEQIALSWGSEPNLYSVSELTQAMRGLLSGEFSDIWVSGEISGVKLPPSGHYYFTLKDRDSQLPCVCFRATARFLESIADPSPRSSLARLEGKEAGLAGGVAGGATGADEREKKPSGARKS